MYKVIIVDDDMIVRVGIRMIGQWEKYNMEVVGEASDGEQGLEIFHLYHPDLVLTDIMMPGMTGIELLKQIRQENKDTRVILLTNFDDKENLKEAIRCGANDFMAKNELNEETMDVLLNKEMTILQKIAREDNHVSNAVEMKKKIIRIFTESMVPKKEYEKEFFKQFGLQEKQLFKAAIIQVNYKGKSAVKSYENEETVRKLIRVISGVLTDYPQSFIWDNQRKSIGIFLMDISNRLDVRKLMDFCISMSNAIRLYTQIVTHICASGLAENIEDLYRLKSQLDKSVLTAAFFSSDKIVIYDQIEEVGVSTNCAGKYKNLLKQMYLCSLEQISEVEQICHSILNESNRERNINLKSLLCSEFAAWYRRGLSMIDTTVREQIAEVDYHLLINAFDNEELKQEIDFLLECIAKEQRKFQITENDVINNILFYINKNYASPLSLKDVADYVNLSKNYVSTLFNNIMQESFAEYLAKVRIEKAKGILRLTDYRISEVSDLVGFSSEKYFSVTFKNIVGITPKEYRQLEKTITF